MEGIFLSGFCIPPKLMVLSCWDGSPAVLAAVPPLCYGWDGAATFTSRLQLFAVIINKSSKAWIWSALPYTLIALNAVKNCERILEWKGEKKESFKRGFSFELWFTALRMKPLLYLTLLSFLFQVCGFCLLDGVCDSWSGVFNLAHLQCEISFPSQGSCCLVLSSFNVEVCMLVLTALWV